MQDREPDQLEAGQRPLIPAYVEIETSRYCNRTCDWCPNGHLNNRRVQELMPWDTFCHVLQSLSLRNYDGWLALHNYNEPLANPRLLEELTHARRILPSAKLSIFTNGDDLSDEVYWALVAATVSYIRITVYPSNATGRDRSHQRLWKWLKNKPVFSSKTWIQTEVRQGLALETHDDLWVQLINPVIDNYYDRGGTVISLSAPSRTNPCFLTSKSLSIDYKGRIKMCCNVVTGHEAHEGYFIGDAAKDDVIEVWNSRRFTTLRTKHLQADWSLSPICNTCTQRTAHIESGST